MKNRRRVKPRFCCSRFEESVAEGKFMRSAGIDETEWFMPEWLHVYHCPFCGTLIKGRGTGRYNEDRKPS